MTTKSTTVTKIKITILQDDLGDCREWASEYASAVQAAIEEAFETAVVDVTVVPNTGGCCRRPVVYTDDDSNFAAEEAAVETVERICESVWANGDKWIPETADE